jgi:hypothetical protein
MNRLSAKIALVSLVGVVGVSTLAPVASAAAPRTVTSSGRCSSGSATWRMIATADGKKIDLELRVVTNRPAGHQWNVRLTDNGVRIFRGTRVTDAPRGSFDVSILTANRAGVDHLVGVARYPATGQVCRGVVNF